MVPPARGPWRDALRRLSRHRLAMAGLAFVALVALLALAAPLVEHHPPAELHLDRTTEGPSASFWLGTDQLGRDLWSQLVHGARISLAVGVLSQAIAVAVGIAVGSLAALGGKRVDNLTMRATDVSYAVPDLLAIILLVSVFGQSFWLVVAAIAFVSWPTIARLVRGQMLSLQQEEFALAAEALGAPRWRVALHHLLPNALSPVIVTAAFGIPAAIFAEAALVFVGAGVSAESWGRLVVDGKDYYRAATHLLVFPCLAVALTMMSFTFIGDGLRDALDPRSRRGPTLPGAQPPAAGARPRLPKAA
jgi:oligopeptide transport system permease protein